MTSTVTMSLAQYEDMQKQLIYYKTQLHSTYGFKLKENEWNVYLGDEEIGKLKEQDDTLIHVAYLYPGSTGITMGWVNKEKFMSLVTGLP